MRTPAVAAVLAAAVAAQDQTQLTIYNQGFAAVKESRTLDLRQGENELRVSDLTAHLEPDSVVLRDVESPGALRVLEQNYESDPLSEGLLLRKSEGKLLGFETALPSGERRVIQGRVLRSGYVPPGGALQRRGLHYPSAGAGQPIVEVEGKIQFGLPGRPLFEALDPRSFLRPTLLWRLWAAKAGHHRTEFSYLTGGLRWEATYIAVAPEKADRFDVVGWVTLENMSGKDFESASVKLMAGDVARAQPEPGGVAAAVGGMRELNQVAPQVTERAFEEYHLYTLPRPTSVLDREVKQVEFVRAAGVPAKRLYIYDGVRSDPRYRGWNYASVLHDQGYGALSNPRVWVMLEFRNSAASGLGMPLPKGTVKVYRRDLDGRNEFVGEDLIDHTPRDETVRLYTGNAFDLVGERRQTEFKADHARRFIDESFEIKVRNHKPEPVAVRVVEHLYRWIQWEVTAASQEFAKTDSRTIEFTAGVPADGEAKITYTVRYAW